MVSRESKALLSNIIRHTDAHNKVVEEAAMWRQREATLAAHATKSCDYSGNSRKRKRRSFSPNPTSTGMPPKRCQPGSERDLHMTTLQKSKEAPADRWGHGGYKELYPEEFQSVASTIDRSSIIEASQKDSSTIDSSKDSDCACHRKKKDKKKKKHKKDRKDRKFSGDGALNVCLSSGGRCCRVHSPEQSRNCCRQRTCNDIEDSAERRSSRTGSVPACDECRPGSSGNLPGHDDGKSKKVLKSKKMKGQKRKKKSKCKTR